MLWAIIKEDSNVLLLPLDIGVFLTDWWQSAPNCWRSNFSLCWWPALGKEVPNVHNMYIRPGPCALAGTFWLSMLWE